MSPAPTRPKRLLVTGGRGRLATLVAGHFRAPGHEVVRFSRESGDGIQALKEITGPDRLADATTLLHLAWSTLPATAEKDLHAAERHDLPLLADILRTLATLPPDRRPHFIFFSSGGTVYGNATTHPNQETDACNPIGNYGRAKLAAEEMIRAAAVQDSLPCTILRISNPYGYPVPSGRAQGIIPHAVRCALEGQPLTLWGDGHARKDFLHYTDFLTALQEVVDRRLTGTFNIAAGESHSVREIIELVEQHTGRKIATQSTAAPAWDVQDSRLDRSVFTHTTGWQPRIDLREGIRRSVAAHTGG